jgi:hypothetical protein
MLDRREIPLLFRSVFARRCIIALRAEIRTVGTGGLFRSEHGTRSTRIPMSNCGRSLFARLQDPYKPEEVCLSSAPDSAS